MKQYVDDTTLSYVSSDARNLENCLVSDIQSVHRWMDVNELKLNVKKTKLLLMSRKKREQELELVRVRFEDQEIKVTGYRRVGGASRSRRSLQLLNGCVYGDQH